MQEGALLTTCLHFQGKQKLNCGSEEFFSRRDSLSALSGRYVHIGEWVARMQLEGFWSFEFGSCLGSGLGVGIGLLVGKKGERVL